MRTQTSSARHLQILNLSHFSHHYDVTEPELRWGFILVHLCSNITHHPFGIFLRLGFSARAKIVSYSYLHPPLSLSSSLSRERCEDNVLAMNCEAELSRSKKQGKIIDLLHFPRAKLPGRSVCPIDPSHLQRIIQTSCRLSAASAPTTASLMMTMTEELSAVSVLTSMCIKQCRAKTTQATISSRRGARLRIHHAALYAAHV